MKRLSVKHFIFLAVCVITACPSPVGSINESGGGNGSDKFLMLKPNRILYALNYDTDKRFDRASDFQVYVSDGGPMRKLDPSDSNLKIEVISTPGFSFDAGISETVTKVYDFAYAGRYIIKGTYSGNTDEYSVEVEGMITEKDTGNNYAGIKWLTE